jgi:hypothetical protein
MAYFIQVETRIISSLPSLSGKVADAAQKLSVTLLTPALRTRSITDVPHPTLFGSAKCRVLIVRQLRR